MSDPAPAPTLPELQHWTWVMGRAQQMMMEAGVAPPPSDDFWTRQAQLWERMLTHAPAPDVSADRRFATDGWRQPFFDWVRQAYALTADHLLGTAETLDGLTEKVRAQWRFAARMLADAMSPANFPLTNPEVIARTIETKGENLLRGTEKLVADLARGQLTHSPPDAFEVGRNLATSPGKVVKRTALYELIQYAPATERVLKTPLVIFPPWINRFYILDLTPEKSFIRWAAAQGVTVFMVSWKSADADMADIGWDDYVAAQIDAIDTVRALLDVPAVHAIGYCVAGTTLAATLAWLTARGEAAKVASATFFTAQVDFAQAGDLTHFVDDAQLKLVEEFSPHGFIDGRLMAATFNLLRGRDLIWNYVVDHYLLGNDHRPFDLLHWNGDTTNLPLKWHMAYLRDLYRDNRLVQPGALTVDGTPLDLTRVETPTYVQAGREDHIAPAESVWAITRHFRGPVRFVLAGSGHIAGVVNPPAAGKYQYWTSDAPAARFADFTAAATETKGSWWPDWIAWLRARAPATVPADGARVPGAGALPPLDDAPGRYVRER